MQQSIQVVVKRTPVLLLILGVLLLLIAAAADFSVTTMFSIRISDTTWRIVIAVIGVILVTLAIYFLYLEQQGSAVSNSANLAGVKITAFANRKEYTQYRTSRLRKARKIDDVTWRFQGYSAQTYTQGDIEAQQKERDVVADLLKKPDVVWRGVAIFTTLEHLAREKPLITNPEYTAFNMGCYEDGAYPAPPRVGFMIVDDQELFIAYPHKSIRLAIKHPDIVKLYSLYFEDVWQDAYKLKQGNKIDLQKLEQIEAALKQGASTQSV